MLDLLGNRPRTNAAASIANHSTKIIHAEMTETTQVWDEENHRTSNTD